ncbi:MAG TPA: MerR family transcriptional regulator [Flavipsychrobacter sp.]
MDKFTVNQLAKISGVSVRTLHHYDAIGLLKPATRTDTGYRYYGREELLRLQQIRFYKELDMPLAQIQEILDDVHFDALAALNGHRAELHRRIARLQTLVQTIDNTIVNLKTENMNYDEMYKGFSKEQVAAWEAEVKERWGQDKLDESKRNINAMKKEQLAALKQEGEDINHALVALMGTDPATAEVQALVQRHHDMIMKFYTCPLDVYQKIGELYVSDERYKAHYDAYKEGLAAFLHRGIDVYCRNKMNA